MSSNPRLRQLAKLDEKKRLQPLEHEENIREQIKFMEDKLKDVQVKKKQVKKDISDELQSEVIDASSHERPYECARCRHGFVKKSNLADHLEVCRLSLNKHVKIKYEG